MAIISLYCKTIHKYPCFLPHKRRDFFFLFMQHSAACKYQNVEEEFLQQDHFLSLRLSRLVSIFEILISLRFKVFVVMFRVDSRVRVHLSPSPKIWVDHH